MSKRAVRGALAALLLIIPVAAPAHLNQSGADPRSEYQSRRRKLIEQINDGIVVLMGAREEEFGEVGRFRQKNYFMYLTGVETPGAFLILVPASLAPGNAALETLFIPPRNPARERWTGPQIGPSQEAEQRFGIREVASSETFYGRLFDLLMNPDRARLKLYTIIPKGSLATLTREYQFIEMLRRIAPHIEVVDASPTLDEMRKIKSPSEIALLQKAVDITAEAQREAMLAIRPGVFEYQVQAALEAAFTRNGAERPGFPSIVGSGFNSTILHYNQNRRMIQSGDLVVVDIGAEYSYYTADITRTYPASGRFTPRQREIYQLVLDAQRAAEKAFKPGQTTMGELRQVVVDFFRRSQLRDQQGNTLDKYFIHGLGHWLGMDVHDVGDYSKPIPPGAVITIEPGIYIPGENLGVRLEDDYLVTETGLLKMSRQIPSDPDQIERLMRDGQRDHR